MRERAQAAPPDLFLPQHMRPISELINIEEPAWPDVQEWIAGAKNPVEGLPANDGDREAALLAVQVTTRSPMGAIVYESGGLLIDHGWLRILGCGHEREGPPIEQRHHGNVPISEMFDPHFGNIG